MRQDLTPAVSDDADTFDVRASLIRVYLAARHEWRVVLLTCAVVLVMATAYAIFWPPIYRAQAVLLSEGDTDTARDAFYVAWSVFRKDDIRTELELFVSAPVLKEVIKREKLTYDDVYHPFVSHLAYLWQTSFVGRNYRRFKSWLLGSEEGELSPEEQDRARTLGDMRAGITLDPVGEAHIGNLTVRGPSRRVSDIANRLVEVYLEQRLERYKSEATGAIASLAEEVKGADSALRQVEEARLKFLQKNRLSFDFDKEKLEVSKLSGLEESIESNLAKIAASQASLNEIERQLTAQPAMRTINTSYELNSLRETTKMKRLELQTNLIITRNRYREDSPEVQEILANMAALDTMIAQASERVAKSSTDALNAAREDLLTRKNGLLTELAGLQAGVVSMKKTAAALRARLSEVPSLQTALRAFDRDRSAAQEKHTTLVAKLSQATVSLAGLRAMPSMRVVEYAARPDSKFWPKNAVLYPMALVAGLMFGLAVAFLKSLLSGRVRREHLVNGRGAARYFGVVGALPKTTPFTVVVPARLVPGSLS